ncbi:MAG: hypothetical protein KF718_28890 [Polyangiaceae bacterium]|nr:hypothetical protein [Polyangiaceae bacterium]
MGTRAGRTASHDTAIAPQAAITLLAAENEWTHCEENDDCRVLTLGVRPYCVEPRGVMAVRHDSARAARLHYGASDAEMIAAPWQGVSCRPLAAECIDQVCVLVEPAPH